MGYITCMEEETADADSGHHWTKQPGTSPLHGTKERLERKPHQSQRTNLITDSETVEEANKLLPSTAQTEGGLQIYQFLVTDMIRCMAKLCLHFNFPNQIKPHDFLLDARLIFHHQLCGGGVDLPAFPGTQLAAIWGLVASTY